MVICFCDRYYSFLCTSRWTLSLYLRIVYITNIVKWIKTGYVNMVVYQLEEDFYKMSFEEILNEVDIVIFDFFDTIMGRKVDDETLIHVWASEVAVKLKYKMSATDIYDSRRK